MKAAKVLVSVLALVLLVVGLVVSGWMVHAQDKGAKVMGARPATIEVPPVCDPKCWQEMSDQLASAWEQAQGSQDAGQYAVAAQGYLDIANQLPESTQRMKAFLEAACCLAALNRFGEAIPLYDSAIALGDKYTSIDYSDLCRFGWNQSDFKDQTKAMLPVLYKAMCGKADACLGIGDRASAIGTMARIRVVFSDCDRAHALRLFPLQAALTGANADQLWAREKAASTLLEEAYVAYMEREDQEAASAGVARILSEYPESMAVVRALDLKGRMLWNHGRMDEAIAVYTDVLGRVNDVAPDCEFARIARSKIAYRDSRLLYQQLKKTHLAGGAVDPAEWQRMRDLCQDSDRANRYLGERIQSDVLVAASYCRQGQYEQAVQTVDKAFQDHYLRRCSKLLELKAGFADLQHWAGYALSRMGRCDDALARFNWVIESVDPAVPAELPILALAQLWTWESLHDCRGSERAASEAAGTLLSRYPGSTAAGRLRTKLGMH